MTICRLCNGATAVGLRVLISPHNNQEYTLYQCKNCGSRFFDPSQHEVLLNQLYENISLRNPDKSTIEFKKDKYWENQTKKLIKKLGRQPQRVLDVGCRTGDFLLHYNPEVIKDAVELSSEYAETARRRGIVVYNDFLENVNFAGKKYDIVTAYAVLEHLSKPFMFLDKIDEIINSQGILAVLIPSFETLKVYLIDKMKKRWHMYSPPEHLNFFSQTLLDHYLSNKGFTLIDRYWTSGGMFNPFRSIYFANRLFAKIMYFLDENMPVNKVPIFDHMYSYYVKE